MNSPDIAFYKYLKQFVREDEGFFIECGANNGLAGSICQPFEVNDGWKGMNIEANPYCYEQLKYNRKNCINYGCAIGEKEEQVEFYIPKGATRGKQAGGATLDKNLHAGRVYEIKEVPMRRLDNILNDEEINNIDLFVLDVEGHELEVLKSIRDIDVMPEVFVIEYSKVSIERLNEIMEAYNYNKVGEWKDNYVYKKL